MFDSIAGLPLHPLVVHAVIVLLPLSALGAILVAAKASWNRTFGFLVWIGAFVATGSAFVAKESGEALASRIGYPADHAEIARWTPYIAGLLFLATLALWWLDRRTTQGRTGLAVALSVVTILLALLAIGWTVVAGHSGAEAVWGRTIENTKPGSQPVP